MGRKQPNDDRKAYKKERALLEEEAARLAEKFPCVADVPCPNHKGHSDDCYRTGWGRGFYEALERVNELIKSGRCKNWEEAYEYYTEGQIAT